MSQGMGAVMDLELNDPRSISEVGSAIYERKYRAAYEVEHPGEFLAINVRTEEATLGETSSAALLKAANDDPGGIFHLIRIGHTGAYEVGLAYKNVNANWCAR